MALSPLPIDPLLPSVVEAIRTRGTLVLQAAPGAGKTTRVPRALLDAAAFDGELWVLEPRRLATRLAAARVAEELGEPVGRRIGYQIRFDEVSSAATRVRFVTEGILTRRLLSDPELRGVGAVVLDEFHERHLPTDLGLALLRRLRERRPALRLVVMSATFDPVPVSRFLGDAPVLTSEGRVFPVEIEHLPAADSRPLEAQVLAGLKRLGPRLTDGHVLVFLPGAAEIRRAQEACADYAERHGLRVLPLHGDLPADAQDRAVRPSKERKLILSTNVAETSVTVDGVAAVIDSGLARVATHSPWSGLPSLRVQPISRASAAQRAGRAGRTRAGVCLRLYTQGDLERRPERDAPEIARADLAETVLALSAAGAPDPRTFGWFEAPPPSALQAAEELLSQLGARGPDGTPTELGRRLLTFPVHPRLGRILVEGERRGVGPEAARAAAVLSERPPRQGPGGPGLGEARRTGPTLSGRSDVLEQLEALGSGERARSGAAQAVERTARQLVRAVHGRHRAPPSEREDALLIALLAGFPDRVARRRRPHAPELVLSGGGSAVLDPVSVVQEPMLLLALDAEQRLGARGPEVRVRVASAIEPEWLLDLFPERLGDEDRLVFSDEAGRVERLTRLAYGAVTLEERRTPAEPSEATEAVLAEALRARGLGHVVDTERAEALRGRLELARTLFPEQHWPELDEAGLAAVLAHGRRSLAEVREADPAAELLGALPPEAARVLARELPERIALPGGRSVQVHYLRGQPPWIASRLQDFFGLREGPALARGRVPLVLHLLAPNQRAVQVTQDLAGFWSRHYPSLRRELGRRYPRHAWPEDPLHASPPAPRRG
ncbi:MAG TPA: ATP-dependent helicase HrpB [Myxococcaceae bacterium]|nr:ATP-dependent helicase HrpB [Myxococcaceae bacterium]